MKKTNTKKIVIYALFAALTCIATMLIKIPAGTGGYLNLGDCIVNLGAFFLGPVGGAMCAGIGSCLADLFSGYPSYAIGTLIIKAAMGLLGALFFSKTRKLIPSAVISELIMLLGYFLFEILLTENVLTAAAGILPNVLQGIVGLTASALVYKLLIKNKYIKDTINELN